MEKIISILLFLFLTGLTIYLVKNDLISDSFGISLLVFTIISSFLVANNDLIKKIKLRDLEIETFEKKVKAVKQKALDDLKKELKEEIEKAKEEAKMYSFFIS